MEETIGYPIPAGAIKNVEARQLVISAVPPFIIRRSHPAAEALELAYQHGRQQRQTVGAD